MSTFSSLTPLISSLRYRSDFLAQRMIDNGWYPSTVKRVCANHRLAFQYNATFLAAPSK